MQHEVSNGGNSGRSPLPQSTSSRGICMFPDAFTSPTAQRRVGPRDPGTRLMNGLKAMTQILRCLRVIPLTNSWARLSASNSVF
jgi:hypothetical protein